MAACTTTTGRDPFPGTPTPTSSPTNLRLNTKRASIQSLSSSISISQALNLPLSPVSPEWPLINVISPTTASHRSFYSDVDEDGDLRSPRLSLITSNLDSALEELATPISPSASFLQSEDELMYDIASEEKPDVPLFDPNFQFMLTKMRQEMKDISIAISNCPLSYKLGSDLAAMKQRAQQLSSFEPITTRTIALVGSDGVGKSSVINALLDQPYIAPFNSKDGCSPSVTIEYRSQPAYRVEPFAIEIDYMTIEDIKELIRELLRSFHAGFGAAFKDVDDNQERFDVRRRAEKAWHTLRSIFRNHEAFTQEFLLRYLADADVLLLDVLQQLVSDQFANRPGGESAPTWTVTAVNAEELSDKLDMFICDPVNETSPALWPFIRLVRVYLHSPVLQSGIVLADCPTPRDLNYASARATERYLSSCHEIFVVTPIDQALSDRSIPHMVGNIGRLRPLNILCTKSDDILIRDNERRDLEVSLQVRAWRQQIEGLRIQVKRSEARRRYGLPNALQEETQARDLMEEMEFILKKFLIERRNSRVATQLIDEYAKHLHMDNLKVFCVSSQAYWEYRHDERERAAPRLELSGIVDLRRYCHSVPAEARFEEAVAFIEHHIPAFLGSLQLWAVSGVNNMTEESSSEPWQVMKGLEEASMTQLIIPSTQIRATKATLNQDFASAIVLPIREHRSEWRNAALETSGEWTKWDTRDYAAFCRHYGSHSVNATGPRNWNEEIVAPMRAQLHSNWGFFHENVEESGQGLVRSIEQVFDHVSTVLKEHVPAAPTLIPILLSTLPHRCANIARSIHTAFSTLLVASQDLESDALYGHISSHITTLMAPAYHAASAISTSIPSSTSTSPVSPPYSPLKILAEERRKDAVTSHIASSMLFSKMSVKVDEGWRHIVDGAFEKMVEAVGREVDALRGDLRLAAGIDGDEELRKVGSFRDFTRGLGMRVERVRCVSREGREVIHRMRIGHSGVCKLLPPP